MSGEEIVFEDEDTKRKGSQLCGSMAIMKLQAHEGSEL